MTSRAIAYNRFVTKKKVDQHEVMGRMVRAMRNLKVSHSQLRIGVGMLRESNDLLKQQIVQLRADVHDLETVCRGGKEARDA